MSCVVIVGGTSGLGLELARHYADRNGADRGLDVVVTGRDPARAEAAAAGLPGEATALAFDLAEPHLIGPALKPVGEVRHLVLAAIERDHNTIADFDVDRALRLATLKLVGYLEVIHSLRTRMADDGSVLLFGGQAKERPYPGSTTVSTVNGGVVGMLMSLVSELKPLRVNALHPGIVGDSPYWAGNDAALTATRARTPTGRLVTMADVIGAATFLLENPAVNGVNLPVDGGWGLP